MNYSNLRSKILAAIKYPPKISAASLQEQLINIVNGLDLGALLLGVATPSLAPNTEANGFYFALQSGTYTNFPTINGQTITVDSSEVAIIVRSGNYWSKVHITTYPTIDPTTKHWMIGNEDTGVLAEGTTPHIDQESGNWMIGTYDTGIRAHGAPGKDAYQPFKGTFSSVQDLNAAYPEPNDGDTAYVEDTVENTTVLKVYDVVNGEWHDTGTTADSPVFGSGQFLSSVKIDDTKLANPPADSLAEAKDVLPIKDNTLFAKISEVKGEGVVVPKYRINGSGKPEYQSSNFAYTKVNCQGYDYVRVLGLYFRSDYGTVQSSFAFYETEPGTDSTITPIDYTANYKYGTGSSYREYVLPVPKNAVWFAANSKNPSFGSLESKFYCYLIKGDLTTSLQHTVVMYGNNLEPKRSDLIPLIEGHTYKVYVKNKNIAISETGSSSQFKVAGYKYNENRVQVKPSYYIYDGSAEAPESYEFTAEAGYLMLFFRANAGEKQVFQIVDVTYAKESDEILHEGIDAIQQEYDDAFVEEINTSIRSQYSEQINTATYEGNVGSTIASVQKASSYLHGRKYAVTGGSKYLYTNHFESQIYGFYGLFFTDEDGIILSRQFQGTNGSVDDWQDVEVIAPSDAAFAYINYYGSTGTFDFKAVTYETVDIKQMKADVENLKENITAPSKLMKVVVSGGLTPSAWGWTNAYYIRTKYNDEKDIIIQNGVNSNGLLTFNSVFVGPNTLTDEQLRTSTYKIVDCDDSTAPFFHTEQYWHLYAQHGYLIPRINNNAGLSSASVGTLWQDSQNRQYNIGFVDSSYIYLLPVFYEDSNGHTVRGWKTSDSASITSLTFVEAGEGTDEGVSAITVDGYTSVQKYPVVTSVGKKFYADGVQITENGTYYCDEFKVSESQVGYDPASVPNGDWFSGSSNRAIMDNAEPLVEFTWSYCYKGANCAMNTTMKLLKEFECYSYGAIQQQFFRTKTFDNKSYTAKIIIPKLKNYNVPFNTLSSNYNYYRLSDYLVDVNDPVDRQIGYLVNEQGDNDYLIGLAAGLSIVSGDTIKEKRNQNIPALSKPAGTSGAANQHFRLGSISPSLDNKFYIAAINTANYVDNQYYMPAGTFHEINCYVSYFDPAQNKGQVYWYKDGSSYVIYCHAQEASDGAQVINVPEFMEGLNLSVVERTNDASLLSETITNGKFYVQYTGEGAAKYIVLKTQ